MGSPCCARGGAVSEASSQNSPCVSLHYLPPTHQVYTSSLDGTLRHWDLRSGLALRTWRVPEPVESFALGPPGHAWLSCPVNAASGRLFRYDLTTGTPGPLRRKIASGSPLSVRGIGSGGPGRQATATAFTHLRTPSSDSFFSLSPFPL